MIDVTLRSARPDEAAALSELAVRSKAYWGYDAEFMEACREELTVDPEHIASGQVVVALVDGELGGFSTIVGDPPVAEVEALFVEPEHIGAGVGIGTTLFVALCDGARAAGFTRLLIEAEPNAAGFYEHLGAVKVGHRPSGSIPGRTLPLFELALVAR
jgi:GNAT superfamily N-acetyltransferase